MYSPSLSFLCMIPVLQKSHRLPFPFTAFSWGNLSHIHALSATYMPMISSLFTNPYFQLCTSHFSLNVSPMPPNKTDYLCFPTKPSPKNKNRNLSIFSILLNRIGTTTNPGLSYLSQNLWATSNIPTIHFQILLLGYQLLR